MEIAEKYLIVIEKGDESYSAYSPDVVGCVATGKTIDETLGNMKSALTFHLEALTEDRVKFPHPRGVQSYLEAVEASAGEDYFLTYISVSSVLPEAI